MIRVISLLSRFLYSVTGFDNSDEAAVIERLLTAFGEGDEEEIVKCTSDPVYKCMDNDVSDRSCDLVIKINNAQLKWLF